MVWEQPGLPKSYGRHCGEERAHRRKGRMIPENTNRIKDFGLGEGTAGLLLLLSPI